MKVVSPHLRYTKNQQDAILAHFPAGADFSGGGIMRAVTVDCAALVQAHHLTGLLERILSQRMTFAAEVVAHLPDVLQQVVASLRPARALSVDGRWEPSPVPATTLPKVRDWLAALVAGDVVLAFGLGHDAVRPPLAANLAIARLYWVDDELTVLTGSATAADQGCQSRRSSYRRSTPQSYTGCVGASMRPVHRAKRLQGRRVAARAR